MLCGFGIGGFHGSSPCSFAFTGISLSLKGAERSLQRFSQLERMSECVVTLNPQSFNNSNMWECWFYILILNGDNVKGNAFSHSDITGLCGGFFFCCFLLLFFFSSLKNRDKHDFIALLCGYCTLTERNSTKGKGGLHKPGSWHVSSAKQMIGDFRISFRRGTMMQVLNVWRFPDN